MGWSWALSAAVRQGAIGVGTVSIIRSGLDTLAVTLVWASSNAFGFGTAVEGWIVEVLFPSTMVKGTVGVTQVTLFSLFVAEWVRDEAS